VDAAENRLLVECGPGTPGGDVLRRYWQPVALAEELVGDRPVAPVTLLGEELVLFRDEAGRLGLLERWCPHRGVDLSFGRLEDGGLRCPFHGWLFDTAGTCLETPAEPPSSTFHTRVCQRSYPVAERAGVIWAWLGGAERGPACGVHSVDLPELPGLDCFVAPPSHVFAFKGMWECNWLQAHEVGIDPAHAAFLHRFLEDDGQVYGQQFRATVADTGVPVTQLMRESPAPAITVEPTRWGFRMRTLRRYRDDFTHVRVSNCIFPNAIAIAMSPEMSIMQWHVPIDDVRCYWYSLFVSYGAPVDAATMRAQRVRAVELPTYRPLVGRAQRWGFDADEQRRCTYTGMGDDINLHDQWAVESPGPVLDRTREHLSPVDVGIRTHRRMFLAALRDPGPATLVGADHPEELRGPVAIDAATTGDDYDAAWRSLDAARRASCPWPAPVPD
jgi:phenylpropionate dioxygenase-like ring-hydroxylating dioxygenase large terminal subunit